MTLTFVLRLAPEALSTGAVNGRVEMVQSGRTAAIHDLGELLSFLVAAAERDATESVACAPMGHR